MMEKQLPPGQFETDKWPILHQGDIPLFDETTWDFRLFGEVKEEKFLSYKELMELPKTISTVNMHCVTTWSKFDTTFEGIALRELLKFVEINEDVKYIKIYGYYNGDRFGYSANLPLETLLGDDSLFVFYRWKDKNHDWQDINPKHGYPLKIHSTRGILSLERLQMVSGIEFMKVDEAGFWEELGYSMTANPYKEERYR